MAQFYDFIAPDIETAIHNYIISKFGKWEENQYIEPDVEVVRIWALVAAQDWATTQENGIDNILGGNFVRAIMLNTEIVRFGENQPTDPNPNVYVIAAAIADRRGDTLLETLNHLLTRWLNMQSQVAAITPELDRLTDEINAAATVAEIEAALASVTWS